MKYNNEIVSEEGKINNISKTDDISHRLLIQKKPFKNNNMKTTIQNSSINALTLKDSIFLRNQLSKLKSVESNSTTSIGSNNEKIKKVTFSTVSIIRIKNYKQYNKLNTYRNDDARNNWDKSEGCNIF